MSNKRYTDEFKVEAVKQVTERGHAVVEVAARLDVSAHSLYQWVKCFSVPPAERRAGDDQQAEIRRLKAELKRVSEERDILKRRQRTSPGSPGEVRLCARAPVALSGTAALPNDGSTSQRLLRLAAGSTIGTYYRGPTAAWPRQAVLAGKRLNLWLS